MIRLLWVPAILALCAKAFAQNIPSDYQAWFQAEQAFTAGRHADVLEGAERVYAAQPASALEGKAALLVARSLLALGRSADAIAGLRRRSAKLPQPEGDALAAAAAEAAGDSVSAAGHWQKVFYRYPRSPQADAASEALVRLRAALGSNYPEVMPAAVFERAEFLRRSGQTARARAELQAAAPGFGGLDRELALVRGNAGDYRALSQLRTTHAEADAERLYLMHAISRRNSQFSQAQDAMEALDGRHPKSRWTMEALTSWGNHWLLRNEAERFLPLYRRCADRFGNDYCHWKVVWHSWMSRKAEAKSAMEGYLTAFPEGDKAAAALYFLGRYSELAGRFPMSWYAVLARSKVRTPLTPAQPDPTLWAASPVTRVRINRARQLQAAGMSEWAEFELVHAAGEQPHAAIPELASVLASRGEHDKALRYIKGLIRNYLSFSLESAPEGFWRVAFPLPWRRELEEASRSNRISPFLLAALIRQESEFNPRAVSPAKAYGLTQVLPSTGRQISRSAGVYGFTASMLFEPEVSLKIGAYHLRTMLDAHSGHEEETLASYNAGKSRTDVWTSWYEYREPAEFVETIPFSETRTYVQAVLRNADVYRRLYGKAGTQALGIPYDLAGE
ncbi:MAG TPA: lytic transglycosylase domain-containing protein [Bryobacteraceae bacterium]|nr:lytic transglycosylase domain-containing protein [Bryobacteraceae bacterium]